MVLVSSLFAAVLKQVQPSTKVFRLNLWMLGILSSMGALQGSGTAYGFHFTENSPNYMHLVKPIIDPQNPPAPLDFELCIVSVYGPNSSPLDNANINENADIAKAAANKVFRTIKGKVVYPNVSATIGTYQVMPATSYFSLNYLPVPLDKYWPRLDPIKELKKTGCMNDKKQSNARVIIYIAKPELTGQLDSGVAIYAFDQYRHLITITESKPDVFKKIINHEIIHVITSLHDVYSPNCIDKYLLVNRVRNGKSVLEDHPASILGPVILRPSFTEYQQDDVTGIYASWLRRLAVGRVTYEQIADISPELAQLAGIHRDPKAPDTFIRDERNKIDDENFTNKTQDPPGCGLASNGIQAPGNEPFKGGQDDEGLAFDDLDSGSADISSSPTPGSRKLRELE